MEIGLESYQSIQTRNDLIDQYWASPSREIGLVHSFWLGFCRKSDLVLLLVLGVVGHFFPQINYAFAAKLIRQGRRKYASSCHGITVTAIDVCTELGST